MLRKRLVTVLTFNDGVLFRTKHFVPDYRYTLNFVDAWSVDEVVVLNITRPGQGTAGSFDEVIRQFAARCFVPLAAGGGLRTLDDVRRYMGLGADKVVVNTGALAQPSLITDIARLYGSQCVVVSIDVRRHADGRYEVFSACGSRATQRSPEEWAREAVAAGAGEILVTSIDRDGSLQGYDLDLCRRVAGAVRAPVLISGGAGNWGHFVDGLTTGQAAAVCTTNIYHFTETSIRSAKQHLHDAGISVRI